MSREAINGRLNELEYGERYAADYHNTMDYLMRRVKSHLDGTETMADMHTYAAEQLLQITAQVDRAEAVMEYVPDP